MSSPDNGKVLVLFGTRPEIIKLAPVIRELQNADLDTVVVSSRQHNQILTPFIKLLGVNVDHDLKVMRQNQGSNGVCSRVLERIDQILEDERPDMILVQGDTTTTLAGAIAGFNRRVAVGHIEAGLRSGDRNSPFPEEMNRRLVSQVASVHFAATKANAHNLLVEGISKDRVFVTGNPVVDCLKYIDRETIAGKKISQLIAKTSGKRRLVLTTHRRESFGHKMAANLKALSKFVSDHGDVCLIFPVHPNPNVGEVTRKILGKQDRVYLIEPLNYIDFVALLKSAWMIVSDSGGVQEEAPSLGKPLLVLRENTERPEAIETGVAKLVGNDPAALLDMLEGNYQDDAWVRSVRKVRNPFGDGKAAERIVNIVRHHLDRPDIPL